MLRTQFRNAVLGLLMGIAVSENSLSDEQLPPVVSAAELSDYFRPVFQQEIQLAGYSNTQTHQAVHRSSGPQNEPSSDYNQSISLVGHNQPSLACEQPSVSCKQCQAVVCSCDCTPWWAHRSGGFAELLFLSAGSSDLIYAVEQTGPIASASPTGPVGISNIEDELGYRFGVTLALSHKSSLVASYAGWEGDTTSQLAANGSNVLNSLLVHPSVATTGAASLTADAYQKINFQIAEILLRRVYRAYDCGILNWNVGARYGNIEQGLIGRQTMSVATGLTTVTTDIDFDGVGILGGFDGERHAQNCGLLVYGRVLGSLLAGNWIADYSQVNQFGGGVIANHYEDFRVTPVLDTELGAGWQSQSGCLRVTSGYLFSSWFNTVNNRDYIQAVRTGNLLNLDQPLTFSGLTFRTELRF